MGSWRKRWRAGLCSLALLVSSDTISENTSTIPVVPDAVLGSAPSTDVLYEKIKDYWKTVPQRDKGIPVQDIGTMVPWRGFKGDNSTFAEDYDDLISDLTKILAYNVPSTLRRSVVKAAEPVAGTFGHSPLDFRTALSFKAYELATASVHLVYLDMMQDQTPETVVYVSLARDIDAGFVLPPFREVFDDPHFQLLIGYNLLTERTMGFQYGSESALQKALYDSAIAQLQGDSPFISDCPVPSVQLAWSLAYTNGFTPQSGRTPEERLLQRYLYRAAQCQPPLCWAAFQDLEMAEQLADREQIIDGLISQEKVIHSLVQAFPQLRSLREGIAEQDAEQQEALFRQRVWAAFPGLDSQIDVAQDYLRQYLPDLSHYTPLIERLWGLTKYKMKASTLPSRTVAASLPYAVHWWNVMDPLHAELLPLPPLQEENLQIPYFNHVPTLSTLDFGLSEGL